MRQTIKEFQENYFENNEDYKIYENIDCAASIFCGLTDVDMDEGKKRIDSNSNGDWLILNSGKVAVNKSVLQ